jgi:hypothetical protein
MRSVLDKLVSGAGLALAAALLVAGGLLSWAHLFIGSQVHDQLSMQNITMPSGQALAALPRGDADALRPYAGSMLDTGPEAKAYADHYIQVHLTEMASGRTYAQVSGAFIAMSDAQKASPAGQQLAALRQNLFMGDTLRGLLLYGYAFATIGTIAGIAAWVAYAAAVVLLVLVALGFGHARRAERPVERRRLAGRVAHA